MTEIQQYEPAAAPAARADMPPALSRRARDLVSWADEARAANAVAQSLAQTSFAGAFRGKPAEATAAILAGNEMGLSPMASLRSFDPIGGVIAMRANAMRGVVQSHGHEVWIEKSTETVAVACGRRAGSETVYRSEWTMKRAQSLGLAGKDNWRKQPIAMLIARATSELCRLMASDVLHGVAYSTEELSDNLPDSAAETAPKRTARRRALEPVPAPEPAFPEPEPEVSRDSAPVSDAESADAWATSDSGDTASDSGWPPVAEPGSGGA